jgi:hypothetical protein
MMEVIHYYWSTVDLIEECIRASMHIIVSNNLNLLAWADPPPHCPIHCIPPHFFQPVHPDIRDVVLLLLADCPILPSRSDPVSCQLWSGTVREFICTVH